MSRVGRKGKRKRVEVEINSREQGKKVTRRKGRGYKGCRAKGIKLQAEKEK